MSGTGTQDVSHHRQPGFSHEEPARVFRRRLGWLALAFWIAYSGAVLGWHAHTAPPADACIVR